MGLFIVRASINGAKKTKGIRATVYKVAERHLAYYLYGRAGARPFVYEGDTLEICVGFEEKSRAAEFQTFLSQWHLDQPLLGLGDKVKVERELVMTTVHGSLERVMLTDYAPADEDSPMQSLQDLQSSTSCLSDDAVPLESRLFRFQLLEAEDSFRASGTNPYRCHLKDQARFKALKSNENNIIAASWPFHQLLDGLNTIDGLPHVRLEPVQTDTFIKETLDGEDRFKVFVNIVYHKTQYASCIGLKHGSEKLSDTTWRSFVHVKDPTLFCECLQWKNDDTAEKWRNDAEPVAAPPALDSAAGGTA